MELTHDVAIIGAGLRAVVELSDKVNVALVSQVSPTRSQFGAAQGGSGEKRLSSAENEVEKGCTKALASLESKRCYLCYLHHENRPGALHGKVRKGADT